MTRKIDITDLDPSGTELDDDRLARVAGGLPMSDTAPRPTHNVETLRMDGPGTEGQTGGPKKDVPDPA